jgi:hypothetical protein
MISKVALRTHNHKGDYLRELALNGEAFLKTKKSSTKKKLKRLIKEMLSTQSKLRQHTPSSAEGYFASGLTDYA